MSTQCYFPNGDPADDEPCDPNALFTQCCGSASYCLSNGLCLREVNSFVGNETIGTEYARGTCTDKTWASSLCPQQCSRNQDTALDAYDFRAGGVQVWQCTGQGFAAEAKYCCESEAEKQRCCQTQSAVFALQGAEMGASTTNTLGRTATVSITSESGSTFTSESRSTITSESLSTITSQSMSTTAPIATASATGQPDENNARNTGIGAGVGAGVGLLILIAGIIFFVRRHKRKNREIGGSSGSEFCGTESNKQPVEIWTQPAEMWTQPAEMWTQPQELPTKAQPVWEMSGNPHTPRIV